MSKKDRIIEAVVALIFGLAMLGLGIFSTKDTATIILGGLLTAIGVGCLVWAVVDKSAQTKCCCQEVKVVEETPHTTTYKAPTKKAPAKPKAKAK